jgi:hypothetical protein
MEALLIGTFIVVKAYIKNTEISQINNPMMNRKVYKRKNADHKISGKKVTIKIRDEMNTMG